MNRSTIRGWLRAIPGVQPAPDTPAFDELLASIGQRKPQPGEVLSVLVPGLLVAAGALAALAAILAGYVGLGIGMGIGGVIFAVLGSVVVRRALPDAERTASRLRGAAGRIREKHESWLNQLGFDHKLRPDLYPVLEEISAAYLRFRAAFERLSAREADSEAMRETAHAMDGALLRALEGADQSARRHATAGDEQAFLMVLLNEMRETEEAVRRRAAFDERDPSAEDISLDALRRSRSRIEEVSDAWEELHHDG